ncbi:hypothetical protein EVAR_98181_1 [Eumeta japonica]|uniref:Uncharacterized protein n=1 Tax=Eumeta variegata TaxID=151549 RepID=A0A4C1YIH4_EUMVA|nr:hypothetical protein EVAR_98181_1 [Eumeta japonica]
MSSQPRAAHGCTVRAVRRPRRQIKLSYSPRRRRSHFLRWLSAVGFGIRKRSAVEVYSMPTALGVAVVMQIRLHEAFALYRSFQTLVGLGIVNFFEGNSSVYEEL